MAISGEYQGRSGVMYRLMQPEKDWVQYPFFSAAVLARGFNERSACMQPATAESQISFLQASPIAAPETPVFCCALEVSASIASNAQATDSRSSRANGSRDRIRGSHAAAAERLARSTLDRNRREGIFHAQPLPGCMWLASRSLSCAWRGPNPPSTS